MPAVKVVVVDLDSTLANTTPRHHLTPMASPGNTWVDYSMGCKDDILIHSMKVLIDFLTDDPWTEVWILSARNHEAFQLTSEWLFANKVIYDVLKLRGSDEHEDPIQYKLDMIREWAQAGTDIKLFIDDYFELCAAVEAEFGIPTLCPRPPYVSPELAI